MIKSLRMIVTRCLNRSIIHFNIYRVNNEIAWVYLLPVFLLLSFAIIKKRDINVVFIGDSITYGAGLAMPLADAPPAQAAKYLQQLKYTGRVKFANRGISGFTTVNFLPAGGGAFYDVIKAADSFYNNQEAQLVFSIMLGTNDSAIHGPKGAPVSPESYFNNLKLITDSLLARYPDCKLVINYPIWYSPNTYNGSKHLQEGLNRLQSYFPEIKRLVKAYTVTHPKQVFTGDQQGFNYFKVNFKSYYQQEPGKQGIFFLHPNTEGARVLGNFWGHAIADALKK